MFTVFTYKNWMFQQESLANPIGSMYAIYGNIYHSYTPNVSIYTSTMDPMGMGCEKPQVWAASRSSGLHEKCHPHAGLGAVLGMDLKPEM